MPTVEVTMRRSILLALLLLVLPPDVAFAQRTFPGGTPTASGSGTANTLMKFDSAGNAADSSLTDDGSTVTSTVPFRASVTTTRTTMSGDITLTSTSNQYQFADPNGANRNVDLPAESTGMAFVIKHIGSANTITVRDDAAATVVTLTAGDAATVVYDGTAWQTL